MKKAFAAIAAAALVVGGCASETTRDTGKVTGSGDIGSLDLRLTAGGQTINAVTYTLTGGPLTSPRTQTVDLTNSSQLKFQVGAIQIANGYTIALAATTVGNNGIPCSGTAGFNMDTAGVKALSMNLNCSGANTVETDDKGDLRVDVAVNVVNGVTCPVVTGISALPAETAVGTNLQLEGFLSSTTGTTVAWTGGTFGTASAAATSYTCTAPGDHDLTFTVNKTGCQPNAYSVSVTCTGGTAPVDSGTAPVDSGTAPVDSGTAPVDSGTAPVDSGTAPVDSGTAPVDSGTAPVDSGTPQQSACQNCVRASTSPCREWNFSSVDNVADCFANPDPSWVEKCTAAYSCAVRSADSCAADLTGLNKCYCGATDIAVCFSGTASSPASALPAGNCQLEVEAATGCNNPTLAASYGTKYKCVEGLMTAETTPSYAAYNLVLCTTNPQGCGANCPLPRPVGL